MRLIILLISYIFCNTIHSQETLDDIFGKKPENERLLSLTIGTSIPTFVSGFANIESNLHIKNNSIIGTLILGYSPFNYVFSLNMKDNLETGVSNSFQTLTRLGFRVASFHNVAAANVYVGPEFEYIKYQTSSTGNYFFHFSELHSSIVPFGSDFYYYRKENRFGLSVFVDYKLKKRMNFLIGLSLGRTFIKTKYNPEKSSDDISDSKIPEGWVKMNNRRWPYANFILSLHYLLSK